MKAKIVFMDKGREEFGEREWVALAAWSLKEGWEPFSIGAEVIPAPEVNDGNFKIIGKEVFSGREEIMVDIDDDTFEKVERWLGELDRVGFWGPPY